MSAFQAEDGGFKSPRGGHHIPRKRLNFDPFCRSHGAKIADVNYFRSLAVFRGDFVKLYNLVHGLTGLTPLVHFSAVEINHLVGAMSGDGLNLTVGACCPGNASSQ